MSGTAGFGNTASETWGAAWGDYNGDGYPDVFFSNHRTRATLYRNNRNGTFTEVSAQVDGSQTPGWTGGRSDVDTHGATWADIDNDGDDDLYESVESRPDQLHINEFGVLYDRSTEYGIKLLTHAASRQSLFLDFNGDRRLDMAAVAIERPGLSPQLSNATFGAEKLLNCANDGQWAHLADVYSTPGLELLCAPRVGSYPQVSAFQSGSVVNVSSAFPQYPDVIDVASLDYDRDLRPDLFIVRGTERPSDAYQFASNRFEAQFITAGGRTKSVTFKSAGVLTVRASIQAGVVAPDGDPVYIDIGSSLWSPSSLTFQLDPGDSRNWGIGTGSPGINIGYLAATAQWQISQGNAQYSSSYVQVSSTAPISGLVYSGASATDVPQKPVLLRNSGSGFVPVTAGFTMPVRCQSAVAGDFDNDMDEDLFVACTGGTHNIANRLYINKGDGSFYEATNAGGAAGKVGAAVGMQAGTSESVVTADYDLDGFLDLLVTNGNNMRPVYQGGPKQLFHNKGNTNSWMEFDLVGTASNRKGVGATVRVTSGGITQYREQNGGYHRWSQNFQRLHVGLGANSQADVTVRWPNGTSTTYRGLQSNRIYRLKQDGTFTVIVV